VLNNVQIFAGLVDDRMRTKTLRLLSSKLFYNGPQLAYVDFSLTDNSSIVDYFANVSKAQTAQLHVSIGCSVDATIGVRIKLCLSQIGSVPRGVGVCVRPLFVEDTTDGGRDPRAIVSEWLRFYVDKHRVSSLFLHARSESLLRELVADVEPYRSKLWHAEVVLAPANFTANQRIGDLADTIDQVMLFDHDRSVDVV
jgi:hypothetical protein